MALVRASISSIPLLMWNQAYKKIHTFIHHRDMQQIAQTDRQATVSIISYLQRPLLAIPIGYARDSILINSPLSSFRNTKTASLIDAFSKSCSCHANIALLVMLYCMLYILYVLHYRFSLWLYVKVCACHA